MGTHIKDDRVQVTGHLRENAQVLYAPGGKTAVLVLEIEPAKGLPYLVVQQLGSTPAAHVAARSKAASLRKGDKVTVYAVSYELERGSNGWRLKLQGVHDVIPQREPIGVAA